MMGGLLGGGGAIGAAAAGGLGRAAAPNQMGRQPAPTLPAGPFGGIGGLLGGLGMGAGGGMIPNLAKITATMGSSIGRAEQNIRQGAGSLPQMNSMVAGFQAMQGLKPGEQQEVLDLMRQQMMMQQSMQMLQQQLAMLTQMQRSMHEAMMQMIRNIR
jgi:hypothetical protein